MHDLRERIAQALYVAKGAAEMFGPWGAQVYPNVKAPFLRQADDIIGDTIAAREAAVVERCLRIAEEYRDGASEWHRNEEANPTGCGYCCLKTAANIVGAIRAQKKPTP